MSGQKKGLVCAECGDTDAERAFPMIYQGLVVVPGERNDYCAKQCVDKAAARAKKRV